MYVYNRSLVNKVLEDLLKAAYFPTLEHPFPSHVDIRPSPERSHASPSVLSPTPTRRYLLANTSARQGNHDRAEHWD